MISDLYKGPRIRIFEMSIEGPFHDQWPPLSHQGIAGTETNASNLNVEQVLLKFASKAFRRPVKLEEITQYIIMSKIKRLRVYLKRGVETSPNRNAYFTPLSIFR